jgi:hypothetical protein
MITGWKNIIKYTGFGINTLKTLVKKENFPLQWIASKPTTTEQAIHEWFKSRLEKNPPTRK